jgi:hypothetical protein
MGKAFLATITAIGVLGMGSLSGYLFWTNNQIPGLKGTDTLPSITLMIQSYSPERTPDGIFDYTNGELTNFARQNPAYSTQLGKIQDELSQVEQMIGKSTLPDFNTHVLEYMVDEIAPISGWDDIKIGYGAGGVFSAAACLASGYFLIATLAKKKNP